MNFIKCKLAFKTRQQTRPPTNPTKLLLRNIFNVYDSYTESNSKNSTVFIFPTSFSSQQVTPLIKLCPAHPLPCVGVDDSVVNAVESAADAVENQADADRDATMSDRLKMAG